MSSLESTIEEVMTEAADIQHKVPGKGGSAPAAKASPDENEPKKDSDAVKKAGEATSPAKAPGGSAAGEKGEELKDGETGVEKGKAVNQEEVEDDSETPNLEEMSKADLLKQAVASMKEMDAKALKSAVAGLSEDDEDGDEDEKSESLSRNALIRKVVESLKDKSIAEVTAFIKELDNDSDEGESDEIQKKTAPVKEASKESKVTKEMGHEDEDEDEDEEEEDYESVKKESYDIDMTDDIEALVADEDLSEEFKNKAKTIFEAAVASKVKDQLAEKEAQLEEEQSQKIEEIKDDLSEKVDSYLNYVAESWVSENELAIERGLKSELTEDFINGLKKLFEEHYVEVPEDKFDVVEELAGRLDDMEDKLNEEVASNIKAQQDIEELQREKIISEATKDLADSEIEKLKELAEDVDFEDEEKFVEKVSTLKEAYFKGEKLEAVSDESNVAFNESEEENSKPVDPSMAGYTAAISKFAKIDS
tara:strand:+ start:12 stop:1445 length:1434 start_codon:yes stop_codon:yes gene_type:complete